MSKASDPTVVGNRIRELRRRMGMTQAELAGSDFTKSFISQVEKGQTRPSLRSLQIIAERLNQPISYFLSDEEVSPASSSEAERLLAVARSQLASNQLREAAATFRKALDLCSSSDHAIKGEIRFRLGQIETRLGSHNKARDEFRLAVEELKRTHRYELYVRCLVDLGASHVRLNDYTQARSIFSEALNELQHLEVSNPHLKLIIQCDLGNVLARLGDYEGAIAVLEDALRTSKGDGEYYLFGKICHVLGYCYDKLNRLDDAIRESTRASRFYSIVGNLGLLILSQINLASHLRKRGDRQQASEILAEALTQASASEHRSHRARIHGELAQLRFDDGNPSSAIDEIHAALNASVIYEEIPGWAAVVASCSQSVKIPQEILQRLEEIAKEWAGDARGLADLHAHLGEIYTNMGDPVRANDHLKRSIALYREMRQT